MLQCNVPSWEYGKPLKQRLLPAHLRRLMHEDSAQLTNWRYRHRSGLYPSESGDGSRCQRPVLCSHRWMTGTRLVRWMRWERPVSPRLQRRATIDPLSILCPSRGGSTSPERHLDSSFPLQLEPGGKQQRWSVGHPPLHSAGCGRSRGAHRTHSSPIPPLLVCGAGATCGVAGGWGGLACTGGSTACDGGTLRWRTGATCGVAALGPPLVAGPLAMAAHYAGRSSDSALCNLRRAAD